LKLSELDRDKSRSNEELPGLGNDTAGPAGLVEPTGGPMGGTLPLEFEGDSERLLRSFFFFETTSYNENTAL